VSIRLEMLQKARQSPSILGDSVELVEGFLRRQQNADGGFGNRTGKSELYYTVFGVDGLLALQTTVPVAAIADYLRPYGTGDLLGFVDACCLARCWAAVEGGGGPAFSESSRSGLLHRIESFRTPDGGYHPNATSSFGTAYGCFLALGAYQDLGREVPDALGMKRCLALRQTVDGAWANEPNPRIGSTPATAAGVLVLKHLGEVPSARIGDWLLACLHPQGGFLALPAAPVPDLLSTATALHALAALQVPLGPFRERCLDFIDSLWTNLGGFHGLWTDDVLDCEYTYYGLLALGHLAALPAVHST
jgi:prenyltransferase beta subunit